jgi:Flp pilus assembly protein TadD
MFLPLERKCLLLVAVAVLSAEQFAAADNWVGRRILPKSDSALLMVGGQAVGDASGIHWPAAVTKANGSWLWVEDDGSTSFPRVAGWLRYDQVVPMNLALDYFNGRLLEGADDGGLYWLRGICWESQSEFELARSDYQSAVTKAPYHRHAHSALARVLSKTGSAADEFVSEFNAAKRVNPGHPRLYWDWGQALEKTDPATAKAHYTTASNLNPHWWQPYYSLGVLAGDQGEYDTSLAHLSQAILRNPFDYRVLRDRAKFQLAALQKKNRTPSPADLTPVLASASKACDLCYYRNCDSLEVMASAFAAMKNYNVALHFQQMAVEQAQLSDKPKHTRKWQEYNTLLAGGGSRTPSSGPASPPGNEVATTRDAGSSLGIPGANAPEQLPAPAGEQPAFVDRSGFSLP